VPKRTVRFGGHVRLCMVVGLLLGCVNAASASQMHKFDIAEQQAPTALNLLAQQASVPLLFPFDEVRGVTTGAVVGEYTVEDALTRLLAGTELQGHINEAGVMTVTAGGTSPGDYGSREREMMGTSNGRNKSRFSLAAALSAIFLSGAASGAEPGVQQNVIEEIVVTAQKREQNMQDVGIAVSSFSNADIRELGMLRPEDLAG